MTTAALAAHSERNQDTVRRRELGAFLRSRRERVSPEQVGLPAAGRRRTPGLRREEVAQLAGVGVTWYTWLEQARDINVSEQVVRAIAEALQLDPYERAHLYVLAGHPEPAASGECTTVSERVHTILRQLEPLPASVQNARRDFLAYNRTFNALHGGLDDIPFEDRNSLLLCFLRPYQRDLMVDWDEAVTRMVAEFRSAMARHIDEPAWKSLVRRLLAESPEFSRRWRQHDVRPLENRTKWLRHPVAGEMRFDYTNLWFGARSEHRLITYTPVDELTWGRLRKLADQA